MCFEYYVKVIVMLCQEVEKGLPKCATYWKLENSPNFEITYKEVEKNDSFIIRKIEVTNKKINERRAFDHIQYLVWPDHDIPKLENIYDQFKILLKFVDEKRGIGPIVVHCSAGVGRTGTFISFYILYHEIIDQLYNGSDEIKFNVFNTVRKLKEYRMYSVQKVEQYKLIYHLISLVLSEKNTSLKGNPKSEGDPKQKIESENNVNNQSENKINDNSEKVPLIDNPLYVLKKKMEEIKNNVNNQSENKINDNSEKVPLVDNPFYFLMKKMEENKNNVNNQSEKVNKDLSYENNPDK